MARKIFLMAITITALLARAAQGFACAVCLSGAGDAVTDGYNASVLFLMATPYAVVASIVGGLVLTCRRAAKRKQEADEALAQTWEQEDSSR